jgi:uncharacterized protein YoaH (UPF0181 family)
MANEALKITHVAGVSAVDANDPISSGGDLKLVAQALRALAAKLDVLTAKLNADAGVTDVNYAVDFASVLDALTLA